MNNSVDLERVRLEFAERLREVTGLRSSSLVRALASVPRERFVGPGPWKILRLPDLPSGYRLTSDDDPRHLYDNVLVALDADRFLNNGEPAFLSRCLDTLDLGPGDRFLHIGCGVGYYTAIAAETVLPGGSVVAVEIDPPLAERAKRNVAAYRNVEVVSTDGSEYEGDPFDAIFVNAGATEVLPRWLDQLRIGGRLLVPLTIALSGMDVGTGQMLLVTRHPGGYAARFVSPVGIFHCTGARTDEGDDLLAQAFQRGGDEGVRSLRRDQHDASPQCWLHASGFCLSCLA
jgi:protein-L-isoaspartate(D-aspartate) O-methyltransferase